MASNTQHDEKAVEEHRLESVDHARAQLKSDLDSLSVWQTVCRFKKAVLVCNLLCIAAAADGYQIVLNGNVIANQGFIQHLGFQNAEGEWYLKAHYTALWGAMQSLGQLIGMVLLNPISDRIGRKMTLYVLWILLAASLVIETVVRDWKDWTGAKILAGIGVGAIQSTLPVYVTEWSPVNIRGALVLVYGFWNSFGKFLPPMVLMLVQNANPLNYKVPILTQWGFLGLMLPIFIWLPETAAYYAARGMDDQGKATLRRVNGRVEGYDVEVEYAIIKNTILEEKSRSAELEPQSVKGVIQSYLDCFRGPDLMRTLGSTLPICSQQLTGLAFLNTYASLFFKQSGFDNAFLVTTIMAIISLVTATCLILATDTFGRRIVVFASSILCTVALLLVGILGQVPQTDALKNFLIFVGCLWSLGNNALGQLGWAFVGEVSSQRLRARTAGLAAGISVIFGLTFNTAVPVMLDVEGVDWGYDTAWLFFATGMLVSVAIWFFVPEPSQRNYAEMDEMYNNRVPARKMRKYVTEVQLAQEQHLVEAEKL
ncbi:MFS general substrate transporter [Corynespora cassiicola Philippines]|uniref:MFS general substrate transporter n=1 Tax=Corynespora cassiicola Philippines TaxID=1448308 RepID=A0A2T2P167_CORCC|nr:MFS general substrate transporter [Corynespora cassiicola Philippines]